MEGAPNGPSATAKRTLQPPSGLLRVAAAVPVKLRWYVFGESVLPKSSNSCRTKLEFVVEKVPPAGNFPRTMVQLVHDDNDAKAMLPARKTYASNAAHQMLRRTCVRDVVYSERSRCRRLGRGSFSAPSTS